MASYYPSFTFLGKSSASYGFIVTSFEPDNGFVDTFLGMDQVSEDYYDGTKKFLYGTRYNNTANISVTMVKADGTDWSLDDNRKTLKWLTGAKTASWLDLYHGDKHIYSFLGTVSSSQQYKLDGRVIGIEFTFTSISPWAYSPELTFDRSISQALFLDGSVLVKDPSDEISVDENGVLCNSAVPGPGANFCIDDDGILYVEDTISATIDNETDDLYSYIYLDIEFINESCEYLEIRNETIGETTRVDNLQPGDIINIANKQFITAYTTDQITGERVNQNRIFGDDFNFVWPRLAPGVNNIVIDGSGNGTAKFSYRYPMKVGDCAMDISTYGGNAICGDCDDIPSYDTVRWQDITGLPTSLGGYGITDAYTKTEVEDIVDNIEIHDVYTKDEVDDIINDIEIPDAYTKDEIDEIVANIEVPTETIVMITLSASDWSATDDADDMYVQSIYINNITTTSRVNLYLNAEQIAELQDANITFTTENDNGVVKVYAIGGKPSKDYEVQASISLMQAGGSGGNTGGSGGDCNIDEDALNAMLEDILG